MIHVHLGRILSGFHYANFVLYLISEYFTVPSCFYCGMQVLEESLKNVCYFYILA